MVGERIGGLLEIRSKDQGERSISNSQRLQVVVMLRLQMAGMWFMSPKSNADKRLRHFF